MKRVAMNVAVAASAVLCLTTVGLWVRSYPRYDMLVHGGGQVQETLTSLGGRIQYFRRSGFSRAESSWHFVSRAGGAGWMIDSDPQRTWYHRLGFDFRYRRFVASTGAPGTDVIVMLPYWFVVLLSGVLPAIWLWKRWRRGATQGLCPGCGYDMRATPDRCPECGRHTERARL
jgi:hypothetical protein